DDGVTLRVEVPKVVADRAAQVEVGGGSQLAATKAIAPARQCALHLGLQFPLQLFDHDIDDGADRLDEIPVRLTLEGEQHLHQVEIGLQFLQRGRIGEQAGKAEIINRVTSNG